MLSLSTSAAATSLDARALAIKQDDALLWRLQENECRPPSPAPSDVSPVIYPLVLLFLLLGHQSNLQWICAQCGRSGPGSFLIPRNSLLRQLRILCLTFLFLHWWRLLWLSPLDPRWVAHLGPIS